MENNIHIINLYKTEKGSNFTIVSTPEIELLKNLGIRIGTQVKVQNRYIWGGPVLLRVEEAYIVAIGKDIAKQITVTNALSDNLSKKEALINRAAVTI